MKAKKNWQMTLLMMKMTSPREDFLAIMEEEVILGSNRVMATMVEMKTKMEVKKSVMLAWIMCVPWKQTTEGKYCMTWILGSFGEGLQLMILVRNSMMGMKRKVTKRGTICASSTNGRVKLNFFLVNE